MRRTLRTLLAVAGIVLVPIPAAAQKPSLPKQLRGFDAYVEKAMRDWKVPGLAIAVVRNDSVVFARGFGVLRLGDTARVDERTLFAIGSSSKAFTSALVAMMVDSSKMKWDDPATQYLPGFQLYDPWVTRDLTVRDLLSHRSGLTRGDLLWYGTTYDRAEILRRVRYLKPSWGLRARFGYQNIMYLAAGQAVAGVAGTSWDDLVRERIFGPLGMRESNTSTNGLRDLRDVAQPHEEINDTVRVISWRNIDNIGPAGSINSNAVEMAQWVRLQLGEGKYGDRQLVSAASMREMHTPQTVLRWEGPGAEANPYTHFMTYGLGWFLQDYRGRKVVQHGGNIDGMSALVAMMPEEKTGFVILTNMDGTGLPGALMYKLFDLYLGGDASRDWSSVLLQVRSDARKRAREAGEKRLAERVTGTSPSLALEKYAGTYADSMYGEATVTLENGKLVASYGPAFVGELEHWHFDTFRANWRDRTVGTSWVTFVIDSRGKPSEMKIENVADFQRVPEKPDAAPRTAGQPSP